MTKYNIGCVRKGNFVASYHVSEVSILLSTSEEFGRGNLGALGSAHRRNEPLLVQIVQTISVLTFRLDSSLRVMIG